MIARLLALALACFVALAPAPARAEDTATRAAKTHFDKGEKLFALGRFDAALAEYQSAFDAKPIAAFMFNIGQCYRNLADYDQAIFSFQQFLKLQPDAPNRDAVEQLIDELEAKRARSDRERQSHTEPTPPPAAPAPAASHPLYTRWWFWTGLAVVGAAGGVGIYEATKSSPPSTDLGNIVFGR